jgi:non-ribosomal peptide synthetase component F
MTLLAAFKTLLYSYSRQEDILVGSPTAYRNWAQLEGLIGLFVNTLVLRSDLSGNPSFQELLARVRQVTLEAYTHQDLPFDKLVDELQLERNLSHNPLFQVWFVLQNTPMPPLELPNLTLDVLESHTGTSRHELKLTLTETSEGLEGSFEYRIDLFDAATIDKMASHFQILLNQIATHPDIKLSDLAEILAETDRQQQLIQEKELEIASRQKFNLTKRKSIRNIKALNDS